MLVVEGHLPKSMEFRIYNRRLQVSCRAYR